MSKKKPRGGKRPGAGRPKLAGRIPTRYIRVPVDVAMTIEIMGGTPWLNAVLRGQTNVSRDTMRESWLEATLVT